MAKAPTCKVCGSPHWSGQPHRFTDQSPREEAPTPDVLVSSGVVRPASALPAPKAKRTVTPEAPVTAQQAVVEAVQAAEGTDATADPVEAFKAQQRAQRATYMRGYRASRKKGAK